MSFKSAREKAGKTVREVMDYMEVSDTAVYYWETGTFRPKADRLLKLAEFYGCTVDDLLNEDTA